MIATYTVRDLTGRCLVVNRMNARVDLANPIVVRIQDVDASRTADAWRGYLKRDVSAEEVAFLEEDRLRENLAKTFGGRPLLIVPYRASTLSVDEGGAYRRYQFVDVPWRRVVVRGLDHGPSQGQTFFVKVHDANPWVRFPLVVWDDIDLEMEPQRWNELRDLMIRAAMERDPRSIAVRAATRKPLEWAWVGSDLAFAKLVRDKRAEQRHAVNRARQRVLEPEI